MSIKQFHFSALAALKFMNMKEFTRGNYTIVFFQKEGDKKYSFLIKNEEELTRQLLVSVKTKRVREDKIKYAVEGIFEKIKNNQIKVKDMKNPIITLSEKMQAEYGQNIETRVLGKTGEDHCPTIEVEIELPTGEFYRATGCNKREAKQEAARKALANLE